MNPELLYAIATVIAACIVALVTLENKSHRKLKKKYRQALLDLQAFHIIEDEMARQWFLENHAASEDAAKRGMRIVLRNRGVETPSEFSAPSNLRTESEKLKD